MIERLREPTAEEWRDRYIAAVSDWGTVCDAAGVECDSSVAEVVAGFQSRYAFPDLLRIAAAARTFLDAAALESMTKVPGYLRAKRALRRALEALEAPSP